MLNDFAITYYTTTTTTSTSSSHGAGYFLTVGLLGLAVYVITVVALWKIFEKAGRPGWAAIVPFYNLWVLFEIAGKPGWWMLSIFLGAIPIVGWLVYFVLYILAMLELAKRFNKSTVFAVFGLIIFSFIGLLMLGFGDAKYDDSGSAK